MAFLAALLLTVWAIAVAVMSTLGVTGRVKTTSVNGMRRRRPEESDEAWAAGLRALYPFTMASALVLLAIAFTVLKVGPELFYLVLLGGIAIVVLVVGIGIAVMNAAIRRVSDTRS